LFRYLYESSAGNRAMLDDTSIDSIQLMALIAWSHITLPKVRPLPHIKATYAAARLVIERDNSESVMQK
jgi:hypothetical protein